MSFRVCMLLFAVVLGVACGVADVCKTYPPGAASPHWPITSGRVTGKRALMTSSRVPTVEARILYSYTVEGKQYENDQVSFPNPVVSHTCSNPAPFFDRYPVGKVVTVYFNPKKPEQSCLRPGYARNIGEQAGVVGATIVVVAGLFCLRAHVSRFFSGR